MDPLNGMQLHMFWPLRCFVLEEATDNNVSVKFSVRASVFEKNSFNKPRMTKAWVAMTDLPWAETKGFTALWGSDNAIWQWQMTIWAVSFWNKSAEIANVIPTAAIKQSAKVHGPLFFSLFFFFFSSATSRLPPNLVWQWHTSLDDFHIWNRTSLGSYPCLQSFLLSYFAFFSLYFKRKRMSKSDCSKFKSTIPG